MFEMGATSNLDGTRSSTSVTSASATCGSARANSNTGPNNKSSSSSWWPSINLGTSSGSGGTVLAGNRQQRRQQRRERQRHHVFSRSGSSSSLSSSQFSLGTSTAASTHGQTDMGLPTFRYLATPNVISTLEIYDDVLRQLTSTKTASSRDSKWLSSSTSDLTTPTAVSELSSCNGGSRCNNGIHDENFKEEEEKEEDNTSLAFSTILDGTDNNSNNHGASNSNIIITNNWLPSTEKNYVQLVCWGKAVIPMYS